MPTCPPLNIVTTPMPVLRAFSMAISIAFGAMMTPSPRSQSMLAEAARSRTMRHCGVVFCTPL